MIMAFIKKVLVQCFANTDRNNWCTTPSCTIPWQLIQENN